MYFQYSTNTAANFFCAPVFIKNSHESSIINDVIDDVCSAIGVQREMLFKKCRKSEVKYARWMVWKIMHDRGHSMLKCATLFGGYDHTTVSNALAKIDTDIDNYSYLRQAWDEISDKLMSKF